MSPRPPLASHPGVILFNRLLPGGYGWLRLESPALAAACRPGQFVHVVCDQSLTLRRPFSLHDADPHQGTVEIFYRVVGRGTTALTSRQPGETLDMLGPIGGFFVVDDPAPCLLLGGGVGLAPVHYLARHLAARQRLFHLLVGMEGPWPFPLVADGQGGMALEPLVSAGLPVRMASQSGGPGVFQGFVTGLAEQLLETGGGGEKPRLFACGPQAMLQAVARLADRFGLEGQVSLEAHMACGFGGCAGCVAPIQVADAAEGWNYRRVCVDGPVFDIAEVAWDRF